MESCDKYDEYSNLPQLSIEEKIYVMSSGDEYDAEPMSKDMLEDIHYKSQSNPSIKSR